MKVERIKSGYYKVEGAKYILIETGYITDTKRCYELNIKRIDSEWGNEWNRGNPEICRH